MKTDIVVFMLKSGASLEAELLLLFAALNPLYRFPSSMSTIGL